GDAELPPVTLIVPAYNEEACLQDKVANVADLDYPRDRLQVIFVSDGSTDRTNDILAAIDDPAIETLLLPARAGQATALNRPPAARSTRCAARATGPSRPTTSSTTSSCPGAPARSASRWCSIRRRRRSSSRPNRCGTSSPGACGSQPAASARCASWCGCRWRR